MGENGGIIVVICLTALIGLGIPAMLYAGLRRGGEAGQIDLLRRAGNRASKPWKPEDDNLAELSRRVDKLRKK